MSGVFCQMHGDIYQNYLARNVVLNRYGNPIASVLSVGKLTPSTADMLLKTDRNLPIILDVGDPAGLDCASYDSSLVLGSVRQGSHILLKKRLIRFTNYKHIPENQSGNSNLIATNLPDITAFHEAMGTHRFYGASGWFFTSGTLPNVRVEPSLSNIVELLALVEADASMSAYEAQLRKDPTISYKLLRYINSPAFGVTKTVSSFSHAVKILGLDALKRWLIVLMLTVAAKASFASLLHVSLVRGRFIELIGYDLCPETSRTGLFMTGVFSLADRLTGKSLNDALATLAIPPAVKQALLEESGPHYSFLELSRKLESSPDVIGQFASSIGASVDLVNMAHIQAISFADRIITEAAGT